MALATQNSPRRREPSNEAPGSTDANGGLRAVPSLLRAAAELTGAERAFLVTRRNRGAEPPRVQEVVCLREDGAERPSRSVLRWATAEEGYRVCLDVSRRSLLDGVSARRLKLRRVISVPVPVPPVSRAALVLDSRRISREPAGELVDTLEALAALIARLLRAPGSDPEANTESGTMRQRFVGRSPALRALLSEVRRLAPCRLPVLILGESGSGKEGIARALHEESPRHGGPFLALNCAAVAESLLESELFGAVRGAYTGADQDRAGLFRLADHGTLFLDEVGDMPSSMQAKLLRVMQDGRVRPVGGPSEYPVDVRILAATHRNLPALVASGRFRQDLFYRIAVLQIRVPALRERQEDLPLLADHLCARLARENGLAPVAFAPSALERLLAHTWPGNVRELESALARALLRSGGGPVTAAHLDLPELAPAAERDPEEPLNLERAMVESALRRTNANLTRAAALIGWSRPKLYRRLAVLGIDRPRPGASGCLWEPESESSSPTTSSDSSTFQ